VRAEAGVIEGASGPPEAALILTEGAPSPRHWTIRQLLDDPAEDHDWHIDAVVDLDASDAAGEVSLRVTDAGRL
jgi:hypothetical protein